MTDIRNIPEEALSIDGRRYTITEVREVCVLANGMDDAMTLASHTLGFNDSAPQVYGSVVTPATSIHVSIEKR